MIHHLKRLLYLPFVSLVLVSLASCQHDDAAPGKPLVTKSYLPTGRVNGEGWNTASGEGGYVELNISENNYHSRIDMPEVLYTQDSLVLYMHDPATKSFVTMWNFGKTVQVNTPSAYQVTFGKVDSSVIDQVGNEWTRVEYINVENENNFMVTFTAIGKKSGDVTTGTFSGIVYPVTYQGDCNGCAVVDKTKKLNATGSFAFTVK